jgi:hypothetical protein
MHREELNPSSSTEEDAPSGSDSDFDPANESGEESQQSLAQEEAPSRGRVTGLNELRPLGCCRCSLVAGKRK